MRERKKKKPNLPVKKMLPCREREREKECRLRETEKREERSDICF
jgi:hypothetical protein